VEVSARAIFANHRRHLRELLDRAFCFFVISIAWASEIEGR